MRNGLAAGLAVLVVSGMAGCSAPERVPTAAETNASQGIATISADQLGSIVDRGKAVLVDVRTPAEFAEGHIAGAVNMPLDSFDPAAVPQVPGKQTVLYCRSGKRSLAAAEQLAQATGSARHLAGGILAWQSADKPVTEAN